MDAKLIFTIIIILGLIYFLFGARSRLLKKKSHHYIVPPRSENDPNWIPIEMKKYLPHIFLTQTTKKEILEEVAEVIRQKFPLIEAVITFENHWIVIKIIDASFTDYHNLLAICTEIHGKDAIGWCKHKTSESEDYIVKLDLDSGKHLIGSFRTNQNFGIYLPYSGDHLKGNLSKSAVKEIDFNYVFNQIPLIN